MRGKSLNWMGVGLGMVAYGAGAAMAAPLPLAAAVLAPPALSESAASGQSALMAPASASSSAVRLAQVTTLASPYIWSATKAADGSVTFDGYVPDKGVQDSLVDNVPTVGADNTKVASGQPAGFVANAVGALVVLGDLDTGKVEFDGSSWSITGSVSTAEKATVAKAAFDGSPLAALGASYTVAGPSAELAPAAAAPATPAADANATPATTAAALNYAWSAEKAGDGTITFNGTLPNAEMKAFLLSRAGAKTLDNSTVAAGAPAALVGGALYGLDALMQLDSGKLLYAGGNWSLAGLAKDAAAAAAAHSALDVVDTKGWRFDIKTPVKAEAAPPAETPPAAAATALPAPAASAAASPAPAAPAPAAPPAPAAAEPTAPAAAAAAETPAAPAASTAPTPPATAATPAAPSTDSASSTPSPAPAVNAARAPTPYLFHAAKGEGGHFTATGQVPTEAVRTYIGDITRDPQPDDVSIAPDAPADFTTDLLAGLDGLARLSDGELGFDGKTWSLKGHASTPDLMTSVTRRIAALPTGKDWLLDVTGPSPLELCQTGLAQFPADAIGFSAGTHLVKDADAELTTLAKLLGECPDARVNVEAFTDSDGDASANMALSVARAEAVIAALASRGVSADRLYAVGYGETLPLVPNTSKANKAKNRRIVIEVEAKK